MKRGDSICGQRVVANAEPELVEEIGHSVDDRRGTHQQYRSPNEPGRGEAEAPGARIPEMMALVHDDESPGARREPAAAGPLVGPDLDGDAEPRGDRAPLGNERCGHQARRGGAPVERRGNGQRHVGLPAPYRIGQQRPTVFPEGGKQPAEASLLARKKPPGW